MRSTTRRLGAAVVTALLAGAFAMGPAHAADTNRAEAFLGSATSTALGLDAFGQKLTLGFSKADVNSKLSAIAEGAGQVLSASTTKAAVTADNTKQEDLNKCATPALPGELASLVNFGIACSSSVSEIKAGAPHANSTGSVASLDVSANTVLNQVIAPVQPALEQVFGTLSQVAPQLDPATNTISDLVTQVAKTQTLALRLGNSTSDVTTTDKAVSSVSTAAGGQIDILPVGGLAGGPLASIIVGSAKASSVYDRVSGKSTPTFDPAIVRVRLGLPALGDVKEIAVAPGQDLPLFEGTPLESHIIVGKGSSVTNPDGSAKAIADGVTLRLLTGIQGGVNLSLAHAEAGVAGAPAVAVPATELPRTGGPAPWLPVAGVTLLAGAIVTRRFLTATR